VYLGDPAHARAYREMGFTLIASGTDTGLLAGAVDERLRRLREGTGA
jgi:2-keto-3-deoxy-L-rhamnonate aldolase RhmA